jgi:hypothetical protein
MSDIALAPGGRAGRTNSVELPYHVPCVEVEPSSTVPGREGGLAVNRDYSQQLPDNSQVAIICNLSRQRCSGTTWSIPPAADPDLRRMAKDE